MLWLFFAQSAEALSGGAGWVGAGLLGSVLSWLFIFHLPAKDKQLSEMIAAKDAQFSEMMAAKEQQLSALIDRFIDLVVVHYKEDSAKLAEALRAELRSNPTGRAGSEVAPNP